MGPAANPSQGVMSPRELGAHRQGLLGKFQAGLREVDGNLWRRLSAGGVYHRGMSPPDRLASVGAASRIGP